MNRRANPISDSDTESHRIVRSFRHPATRDSLSFRIDSHPDFHTVPKTKFPGLFIAKCRMAAIMCDFATGCDPRHKAAIIVQLERVFRSPSLQRQVTVKCAEGFVEMVTANLENRCFVGQEFVDCEDAGWSLVSLVYSSLRAFLATEKGGVIGPTFVGMITKNALSMDARERVQAKYVLHAIYSNFVHLRGIIRSEIYHLMIDGECSNELLDVVGSFVLGFSLPLKDEHLWFFRDAVLHVLNDNKIMQSVTTVVVRYIQQDIRLYPEALASILMRFPVTSPKRQTFAIGIIRRLFTTFAVNTGREMADSVFRLICEVIASINADVSLSGVGLIRDENVLHLLHVYPDQLSQLIVAVRKTKTCHWSMQVRNECVRLDRVLTRIATSIGISIRSMTKRDDSRVKWNSILAAARRRDRCLTFINNTMTNGL